MSGEVITEADIEPGRHNTSQESLDRFIRGASWKRNEIVVIIPASDMIPAKCVLSWLSLQYPPNNPVARWIALNMEVGEAYSQTFANVVDHPVLGQWKYILTIEHDNVPPPDGVLRLVNHMDNNPEFDAIGGLYWTKGEGGVPQIWGDMNEPINFRPQAPNGIIQECWGVAMGFTLWRIDMFRDPRLERPWFRTVSGRDGYATQDLFFWGMARGAGHRCAVANDVLVGHYDPKTGITW